MSSLKHGARTHSLGQNSGEQSSQRSTATGMSEPAWFLSLEDAQENLDSWRKDYNERRSHSVLDNRTPQEFSKFSDQACLV